MGRAIDVGAYTLGAHQKLHTSGRQEEHGAALPGEHTTAAVACASVNQDFKNRPHSGVSAIMR